MILKLFVFILIVLPLSSTRASENEDRRFSSDEANIETENQELSTSPIEYENFDASMSAVCGQGQRNQIQQTTRMTHHYIPLLRNKGPKASPCHNIEGVCKYNRNGSQYIYSYTGGRRKRQRGFQQHAYRNDKLVSQAFCKHGSGYGIETNCKHPCRSLVASKEHHSPGQVVFFPELVGKTCGSGNSQMIHDGFMIINDSKSAKTFNHPGRFGFFWGDCSRFSGGVCRDGYARNIDQLLSKSPYCVAWSPEDPSHNDFLKEKLSAKLRSEAIQREDQNAAQFDFSQFIDGGQFHRELNLEARAESNSQTVRIRRVEPAPEPTKTTSEKVPAQEESPEQLKMTPELPTRNLERVKTEKQDAGHSKPDTSAPDTAGDSKPISTKPISRKQHSKMMKNVCGNSRRNSRQKSAHVSHYYVPLLGSKGPNASACHNVEGVCKYSIKGTPYIYNFTGGGVKSNKGFRKHAFKHHKRLSRAYCKNGIGYGVNINCTHPCRSLAASKRHHVPGQVIFFPELVGKKCGSGKSAMIHDGLMVVNDTGSSKRFNHKGRFDFFWGDCNRFKSGVCRDGIAASISELLSSSPYCEAWSPRNPLHNQDLKISLTNKIRTEALRREDRNAAGFDLDDFVRGGKLYRKIKR